MFMAHPVEGFALTSEDANSTYPQSQLRSSTETCINVLVSTDGGWVSEKKQEVPNSKFEPNRPSHPHPQSRIPTWPGSDFHRLFNSSFALSALMPPSELVIACMAWFRRRHCRLYFFSNCLSSELRLGFCQHSRAFFALGAIYFGIFARRTLVRSRTPKILCLSNVRFGDLHFGTSFVALRALVREIIPNTIPNTIPPLYTWT